MDAAHTTKDELALSAFIGVYPRLISFRALWPLEHIPQCEMYNSRLARRLDPPEIPVVQLRYRLSEIHLVQSVTLATPGASRASSMPFRPFSGSS